MRLVTYEIDGRWCAGIMIGDRVVNAAAAAEAAQLAHGGITDWASNRSIIQIAESDQTRLENAARLPAESGSVAAMIVETPLGPPITDPDKIICLGLNHRDHAEEAGFKAPTIPILFAKYRNALTGPTSPNRLPGVSDEIDYEGEDVVEVEIEGIGLLQNPVVNAASKEGSSVT
jgi:acylpyruvate hydrolase